MVFTIGRFPKSGWNNKALKAFKTHGKVAIISSADEKVTVSFENGFSMDFANELVEKVK